jgi:hypothetical protein
VGAAYSRDSFNSRLEAAPTEISPILRSLKVISLLSMQKKLAKDIFTLKKDGAKRHQQIFNFQSSIFISGLPGLG